MSEPCEKAKDINDMQLRLKDGDKALVDLRIKQVEIGSDVAYVKQKLDNGMSTSLKKIEDTVTRLDPVIAHHADIIKRIEDVGWLISRYAIVTGLTTITGLVVWAIGRGFTPKL